MSYSAPSFYSNCPHKGMAIWAFIKHNPPISNENSLLNFIEKDDNCIHKEWITPLSLEDKMYFAIIKILGIFCSIIKPYYIRADYRFASRQWETSLQSNTVSHWMGANLESAWLYPVIWFYRLKGNQKCRILNHKCRYIKARWMSPISRKVWDTVAVAIWVA